MNAVAAAVALTIATTGPITAPPHVDSRSASFDLVGTAPAGEKVDISVKCALGPCRETTRAGASGNWDVPLNLVERRKVKAVTIKATSDGQTVARRIKLNMPAYAKLAPYTTVGRAPSMAMIGDSLSVGSATALRKALPDWKVTTDGRFGRPLQTGMDILERTPLPFHPIALGFSLFSNDDPAHLEELDAAVRLSIDRLGPQDCAIWATIVRPAQNNVPYDYANGLLRALAAEFADRMILVDWQAAIAAHPEWLGPDLTHPTVEGYRQRAHLFATAAQQCRTMRAW